MSIDCDRRTALDGWDSSSRRARVAATLACFFHGRSGWQRRRSAHRFEESYGQATELGASGELAIGSSLPRRGCDDSEVAVATDEARGHG